MDFRDFPPPPPMPPDYIPDPDTIELLERLEREEQRKKLADAKLKTSITAEEVRKQIDANGLVSRMLELAVLVETIDKEDVPAYSLKFQIYNALLKKVMPDLKALEVKTGTSKANKLVLMMTEDNNIIQAENPSEH
jgi:hypothetical protein